LLTVKGASGHSFSSRLTHRGGSLNVNVAFGGDSFSSPASPVALSKYAVANASGEWAITVSAPGYADTSYTLGVVAGENPLQNITLEQQVMSGTFIDERDDQTYRWVRIGSQVWMAENLNWSGDDGDFGWCYGNDVSNCDLYGRLYDWNTVMAGSPSSSASPSGVRGVCPAGWHVPSDAEWTILMNYVGSSASTKLKSTTSWNSGGGGYIPGTDDFGFSALPGGHGDGSSFGNTSSNGYWWSATEYASDAWVRFMYYDRSDVGRNWYPKANQISLRCLQD
jgi:uncharacterized protein (TIGR02145 family)